MKRETLTILTNDPSMTAWGYAVIRDNIVIATGCIKTSPEQKRRRIRAGDDRCRRISEINNCLLDIIKLYNVNYILSELPHGSQNASAAVMIGMTAGIVQTISDVLKIGIEWYSEEDSKKCVLKKRSATKTEMVDKIKTLYKVKWTDVKYRDEAVADAIAIHYTACNQSPVLKLYR